MDALSPKTNVENNYKSRRAANTFRNWLAKGLEAGLRRTILQGTVDVVEEPTAYMGAGTDCFDSARIRHCLRNHVFVKANKQRRTWRWEQFASRNPDLLEVFRLYIFTYNNEEVWVSVATNITTWRAHTLMLKKWLRCDNGQWVPYGCLWQYENLRI